MRHASVLSQHLEEAIVLNGDVSRLTVMDVFVVELNDHLVMVCTVGVCFRTITIISCQKALLVLSAAQERSSLAWLYY